MDVICWNDRSVHARIEDLMGSDMSSIERFIASSCFVDTTSRETSTTANALYRSYLAFCERNKFSPVISLTVFVYLQDLGIRRKGSIFHGIRLRETPVCDYVLHRTYGDKKAKCPKCHDEKISISECDSAGGINRGRQLLLKTRAFGQALRELANALRDYVTGSMTNQ